MRSNSVDAWLHRAQEQMARWIWPSQCVLCARVCGDRDRDLCAGCEADFPKNENGCSICAEPLSATVRALLCGECVQHPPRFDACVAPFRYAYPIDHMIRGLKYGGAVAQGRVLGEILAAYLAATPCDRRPQALLPVPLAAGRFRDRGYNQAIVLAQCLQGHLSIPVHTDVLVRTRETPEQAGLDRRARRRNIRGAFALVRDLPATHVAIIDDVVTTGSTVNEIARVLKRAGVDRVDVWAVARAGR